MFSNKALTRLILPIFLDQLLLVVVGLAATMMLSHAGEAAVSGVSLVDMINMLLLSVLAAVASGGAVVVSQYIGRRDFGNACHAASQLTTVTLLFSGALTLAVELFHGPLLRLIFGSVDADVMSAAVLYFIITGLSYPFFGVYNACAAIFRSMGQSRIPMLASILMNVLNLGGSAFAIFVLKAGVAGVGISALLARVVAATFLSVLVLNRRNEVHIRMPSLLTLDGGMIRRILGIAVPNGIENGITQLGRVMLISIVSTFGTVQIAANGVANSLAMIAVTFAIAMNYAIITVVGQCIGAGEPDQAADYVKRLMRLTYIVSIAISLIELAALPWLQHFFAISDETNVIVFRLMVLHNLLACVLWPTSFTLPCALRAAGDVKFTMGLSVFSMFVFRVSFAYLLSLHFGLGVYGVWIAMCIDWAFRAVVYVVRFSMGKWKELQVI